MAHRIVCYTLFDITQTGVLNRQKPVDEDLQTWILKRNTQCNFDTILQVISLRSQPDVLKYPKEITMTDAEIEKFGFLYENTEKATCWKFEFEVHHSSVFENGITSLGALYNDCDQVPMISCPGQLASVPPFLDISNELRNIYFEALDD